MVLPFPYLICFLRQQGVQQLDVPLVVHPLGWFFCLLGCGSFHLIVPFISPILGALVYSWLAGVSSISSKAAAIKPQSLSKENKTLKPSRALLTCNKNVCIVAKSLPDMSTTSSHQSGSQNISVYVVPIDVVFVNPRWEVVIKLGEYLRSTVLCFGNLARLMCQMRFWCWFQFACLYAWRIFIWYGLKV